jgi:predicted CDP-diglyceride synthetase/phosphatidate cytidylyltransferase
MGWAQIITLIGVNIALVGALATLIIWAINKLDADVKSIGNRLDGHATRIDQLYSVILKIINEKK